MRTRELQDAYGPSQEDFTPIHEVAVIKLRSMMHAYLNGTAPVPVVTEVVES